MDNLSDIPALWQTIDDLWGCIARDEISDLQPETVEMATRVHELLHHRRS